MVLFLFSLGCNKPCKTAFNTFKPNFCLNMHDVEKIQGIVKIPEDMPVYKMQIADTIITFYGDLQNKNLLAQSWEFPIDSSGVNYIKDYLWGENKFIGCLQDPALLEYNCFYVHDLASDLFFTCNINKRKSKNNLFIMFDYPKIRK